MLARARSQLGVAPLSDDGPPQDPQQRVPRVVERLAGGASFAACGALHTVALGGGGRLFVWGSGPDGCLGLGAGVEFAPLPRSATALALDGMPVGRAARRKARAGECASACTTSAARSGASARHAEPEMVGGAVWMEGHSFRYCS